MYKRKGNYKKIRLELFYLDNTCGICGKEIKDEKESTIDHIIPLSKGGADKRHNMQLAHNDCNNKKGNGCHIKGLKNKNKQLLKVSIGELIELKGPR